MESALKESQLKQRIEFLQKRLEKSSQQDLKMQNKITQPGGGLSNTYFGSKPLINYQNEEVNNSKDEEKEPDFDVTVNFPQNQKKTKFEKCRTSTTHFQ